MKRPCVRGCAALISLGLSLSAMVFAEESSPPAEPQEKSAAAQSVQPQVDKHSADKAALRAAFNTLMVTTDVIPLPTLRARILLGEAESVAESEERDDRENEILKTLLAEAKNQLELAEVLGYGTKGSYRRRTSSLIASRK